MSYANIYSLSHRIIVKDAPVKTKRRTEVTIELDEVVIRRSQAVTLAWCDQCGERVQMFTAEAASVAAGLSSRSIYRAVEARRVHFVEIQGGSILVCLNSLSRINDAQLLTSDRRLRASEISAASPVVDIAAAAAVEENQE